MHPSKSRAILLLQKFKGKIMFHSS